MVSSGGLYDFLGGPYGGVAHEALAGFRRLRMRRRAVALGAALATFPRATVPPCVGARRPALARFGRVRRARPRELEARLGRVPALWPYFRRYVEAHPAEFFRE